MRADIKIGGFAGAVCAYALKTPTGWVAYTMMEGLPAFVPDEDHAWDAQAAEWEQTAVQLDYGLNRCARTPHGWLVECRAGLLYVPDEDGKWAPAVDQYYKGGSV